MRKNHHGKKDRLVKRVFALCLALAVICTCLVPVFATEGLIDPQVHQEAFRPVDDGEASYPDDEFAGFGEEEATRPVDGGEAAGFGEDEVATRPVEGGEDNLDGGPNVKETEWGTVIEYDTSTSTSTDPSSSTETQWSGEDDVVEKPDDKVVVSGDEIKKLQDMVVYRFWLKELNANDLQDITAQAQINNMTESEYLARNGEVLWNLYFIQAVPRAETIADYSSYINTPSSNRDPKGELRLFDYWYTLDEFGNRVRLNLTDPTSNILDDKTTTVNVYAAWKDGTVGSDEEEDVDHEDLVDKNPVPVDLTAKASASYEDEDGELKTTTLPVEVKNLPSAAHSLSVIHMGDDDMERFYESHEDSFGKMMPILGLKISPKNAKGEKVQLAEGEKATVTVSGLNKLPEIAAMEGEGALTADALKVLHQTSDGSVETLDVLTYTNGTLTFETSSFSPFVIALEYPDQGSEDFDDDGIEIVSIEIDGVEYPNVNDGISTIADSIQGDKKVPVGATITLRAKNGKTNYNHTWRLNPDKTNGNAVFINSKNKEVNQIKGTGDTYKTVRIKVTQEGKVTVAHRYGDPKSKDPEGNGDELEITVVKSDNPTSPYNLYVYTQVLGYSGSYYGNKVENKAWNGMAVGTISNVNAPSSYSVRTSIYDTAAIDTKLGTEIIVNSGQFPVIPIKQNGQYKDYYYESLPKEIQKEIEKDPTKADTVGTYTIEWYEVVAVGGANTGKNGKDGDWKNEEQYKSRYTSGIYKSPISSVSSNKMTYHLDGLIVLHDTTHINVQFKVQDVGKDTFALVRDYGGAFTVPEGSTSISLKAIARPDVIGEGQTEATCPKTKTTPDGTVYTFDGWYTNQDCTEGSKFDFDEDTIKEDTTFYAKYVPASANLTVTKTVTGKLGDTNKAFTFTITKDGKPVNNITEDNIEARDGAQWLNDGNGKFTLKDGASITFKNLPSGEYKIVEDDYIGEKYETSWQIGTDGVVHEKNSTATVTIDTTEQTVHFTNHRTLEPDLGVLLDTLPYIVILAVVAGGVALLMLRKHRKEDD